jgi:transcriptional regulator with XRE-family HTH domain
MSAKETIKILLVKRNMTVKKLAEMLSVEKNKTYSRQNLSNKINRSTINYDEMEDIAKILGYKIVFEDIEGK